MTRLETLAWIAGLLALVWYLPQVLHGIHDATHLNAEAAP